MAKRLSTGFVNGLTQDGGFSQLLSNGVIEIYTGAQPATADAASTGTLLCTFTKAGGVYTAETVATSKIDLTGITTDETITSITVAGIEILGTTVTYATSDTVTAAAVAAAINTNLSVTSISASATGAVIIISAPKNSGIKFNNATIVAAGTGVWNGTASHFQSNGVAASATPNTWSSGDGRFGSGAGGSIAGVAAINGLNFTYPNATTGVLVKEVAAWQGTAVATGTAGWFRFKGDNTSSSVPSTTAIRYDGSVGTSGSDMIVSSTAITSGAVQTLNRFEITIPTSQN